MDIDKKDAEIIVKMFFSVIDANYGRSIHHIGDGDGITTDEASAIRKIYVKYADAFFSISDTEGIRIVETL